MTTSDALIASARALLGVRFAHQGRHSAHGLDCLGMLLVAAERAGIVIGGQSPLALSTPNYGTRPDTAMLRAELERWLAPVAEAQSGDVLLLDVQGDPQHLALVTDYPQEGELGMIHAYAVARKVVEHRYDAGWRKATRMRFRLR
jgi:cell wall-associated NlpC family hydrolase